MDEFGTILRLLKQGGGHTVVPFWKPTGLKEWGFSVAAEWHWLPWEEPENRLGAPASMKEELRESTVWLWGSRLETLVQIMKLHLYPRQSEEETQQLESAKKILSLTEGRARWNMLSSTASFSS